MTPAYGTRSELHPLDDGSFAVDDPASPERIGFDLAIDGTMQRLSWGGWSWYRSSMD